MSYLNNINNINSFPPNINQINEYQKIQLSQEYMRTERGLKMSKALSDDFEDWYREKLGIQKPADYEKKIDEQSTIIKEQSTQITELSKMMQDITEQLKAMSNNNNSPVESEKKTK